MKILLSALLLVFTMTSNAQTINITGRLFYDVNRNHIFDGSDSALANRLVYAAGNNGYYSTNTNTAGQYSLQVAPDTFYIGMNGYFDYADYHSISAQFRTYTAGGSDVVNFAYQLRDSIENVTASFDYFPGPGIPPSGASRQMRLEYCYDGLLPAMPATVRVNFNPKLGFVSASVPPTLVSSGKLEWYFPNVQRNVNFTRPLDSILVTFSFPAVGDTIGSYRMAPKFIPGITVSNNYTKYFYNGFQKVDFPDPQPVGNSNGVKWVRQFEASSINANDECWAVDTSQNGSYYFIAGDRAVDDTANFNSRHYPFIAKLNKDGLSVWEKYIDSAGGNQLFHSLSTIKHTPDGGCLVTGSISLADSGSVYYNDADVQVAKFDSSGNFQWKRTISGSKYDEAGEGIELLPDGSCLVTGTTISHDRDFQNNNADTLHDNLFVAKISSTGNLLFTKVYGGSKYEYGGRIKALQNGTFIILGSTDSNDGDVVGAHQHYTIGPEPTDTLFSEEAWVLNINSSGNIIWSKCFGGRKNSYFGGVAENNGGILLTGTTDSKDGDLSYYPEYQATVWALQISTTGNILWSKLHKMYKGYQDSNYLSFPEYIYDNYNYSSLHKTKDGNFMLACVASDKYGAIRGKHGAADVVVIKLNTSGDILWQKAIGGTKVEDLYDIMLDNNDDVIFVGSSSSENDDMYQHMQPFNSLMLVGKAGITNIIKGHVFVDNNGNHIKDAGEHDYSQGRVNSIKAADTISARIFSGSYLNNVDTGNYVSSYKPANNYYTVFPATHNSVFPTFDLTDSVDFALAPKPNVNDLEVQLIPLSIPRPGFDATYQVITKNVGTTTINNAVVGFVKDSRQTYSFASRPEDGILADSIWWGPFTLNAFDIDTLYITLNNQPPPTLNNGDTLTVKVTANPVANDSSQSNNEFVLRERVRGSFDPNDKSEIHAGTLSTTQYAGGDYLQYQVRFQNTGTDTAFFITVKDTLQSKLDLSSMEIVAASHPYSFRLNGNVATWDFRNIKLPDSTTDEPASHGYIVFKVKPKTGLPVGDIFSNNAAIYFDYNLPVITNQDQTVIGSNNGVCPGGNTSFVAGITGSSYQWQVNTGAGFVNLSNGGIYSGVNTATLQLTGAATSLYGYRYRCLVNGSQISPENILKFSVEWTGDLSNAWEDPDNWTCGVLPDAKTEVLIPAGTNYPLISSNAACYSLRLAAGSIVTVGTGFNLNITGKLP